MQLTCSALLVISLFQVSISIQIIDASDDLSFETTTEQFDVTTVDLSELTTEITTVTPNPDREVSITTQSPETTTDDPNLNEDMLKVVPITHSPENSPESPISNVIISENEIIESKQDKTVIKLSSNQTDSADDSIDISKNTKNIDKSPSLKNKRNQMVDAIKRIVKIPFKALERKFSNPYKPHDSLQLNSYARTLSTYHHPYLNPPVACNCGKTGAVKDISTLNNNNYSPYSKVNDMSEICKIIQCIGTDFDKVHIKFEKNDEGCDCEVKEKSSTGYSKETEKNKHVAITFDSHPYSYSVKGHYDYHPDGSSYDPDKIVKHLDSSHVISYIPGSEPHKSHSYSDKSHHLDYKNDNQYRDFSYHKSPESYVKLYSQAPYDPKKDDARPSYYEHLEPYYKQQYDEFTASYNEFNRNYQTYVHDYQMYVRDPIEGSQRYSTSHDTRNQNQYQSNYDEYDPNKFSRKAQNAYEINFS